jgi:hypothetical protein
MTAAVDVAQYGTTSPSWRNRIINGGMTIDQRNVGASVTPANAQYTVDRWAAVVTQASKFSVQQNAGAVTPPVGFVNYLGATSLSAYAVLTGDAFGMYQLIEGSNVSDLGWGTANAQTVTLSFWVRSSLTGTFGGSFLNDAANRSYVFSYTISAANTWEYKTITVTGDTSGTWLTTNGIGVMVRFGLGSGSTFTGTAGSWGAGNIVQPTGSVSVVGTSGATFYITGVQLEKGSTATPFEFRSIGDEFGLCERYYQTYSVSLRQYCIGSDFTSIYIPFGTAMRVAPTATRSGGTFANCSFAAVENINANSIRYTVQASSTTMVQVGGDTLTLPAEL